MISAPGASPVGLLGTVILTWMAITVSPVCLFVVVVVVSAHVGTAVDAAGPSQDCSLNVTVPIPGSIWTSLRAGVFEIGVPSTLASTRRVPVSSEVADAPVAVLGPATDLTVVALIMHAVGLVGSTHT